MVTSRLEIFNWALSIVGARDSITDADEDGREAEVCNLWYEGIRDDVLRAAPWPSATKVAKLALLSKRESDEWTEGAPHPGHAFAYAYPNDMIRPQYLSTFAPFTTGLVEDDRPAIMTNEPNAVLTYTMRQTRVGLWEADLQLAIAHGLAAYICSPLNAKTERIDFAIQMANQKIMQARINAANQDMRQYDTSPEWFTARGYGEPQDRRRFVFPYGELLAPPIGWRAYKK